MSQHNPTAKTLHDDGAPASPVLKYPPTHLTSADFSNETTPSISSRVPAFPRIGHSDGLTFTGIPDKIHKVEYAVRGCIAARATEIAQDFSNKPFSKLVPCHIGNPMALGMRSLTYIRETISLMACPQLLERSDDELSSFYALDTIARARRYTEYLKSPGAYTESLGALGLRSEIARFYARRDGVSPPVDHIMVTNGASEGISTLLTCLLAEPSDGILLPVPQYPLYTAVITKLGGTMLPCYLDESKGWALSIDEVRNVYNDAIARGVNPKALVCINPGNPAPSFLSESQVLDLLKFAESKNLLIIADEVYQENCYDPTTRPFVPFRKVLLENKLKTQLASVHSSSKGYYGECGFRGGCCILDNIEPRALAVVQKMRSIELCSNTMGQCVVACVTNPPQPGDSSYEKYQSEKLATLEELKIKAALVSEFFNSLTDTTCVAIYGALYAFPKIEFSKRAIQEANKRKVSVEQFYCLELLEATGIVTSNGDGFGQVPGTHHIRLAFLPNVEELKDGLRKYRDFHENFMATWKDDASSASAL